MSGQKPTRVDSLLNSLMNHRWLSLFIAMGVVVIAVGAFSDAISKVRQLFSGPSELQYVIDPLKFYDIVAANMDASALSQEERTPDPVLQYIEVKS